MDRYDVVALAGLMCLAAGGAWQWGAPVGLMILGLGLIVGAVLGARSSTPLRSAQNADGFPPIARGNDKDRR